MTLCQVMVDSFLFATLCQLGELDLRTLVPHCVEWSLRMYHYRWESYSTNAMSHHNQQAIMCDGLEMQYTSKMKTNLIVSHDLPTRLPFSRLRMV